VESPGHSLAGVCRTATILVVCALTLLACSKEKAEAPTGQVVARVGDQDVTAQELQNEFHLANVPVDKQKDPAIVKQLLRQLVLRKYLLQQAVTAKLDREPGVLLDILRSREQILASAYINRTVSEKTVNQADIDKYIADNPLKFANRQLVSVDQIVFPIGPNAQAAMDATKDLKTLDAIDQTLTSMNIPHSRSMGGLNTADIPETLFNTIQAKKADDVFFIRSGQNGVFFKVTGEQPRPLEGEAASNMARQFIRADNVNAELGAASVAANLDAKYQGEYATIMSNDSDGKK
jgi:EpsD family peptidyl-prolyl cis-trans isomerase